MRSEIEKIALKAYEAYCGDGKSYWSELPESQRERWRNVARVVRLAITSE